MTVDPLSQILTCLKPRVAEVGGFDLAGDWGIGFRTHRGLKCYALMSGSGWLRVDGEPPVAIAAGDCVLLPTGRGLVISNTSSGPAIPFDTLAGTERPGGVIELNGGGATSILAGHFDFLGAGVDQLFGAMAPLVPLRDVRDKAGLRWILDAIRHELQGPKPASDIAVDSLARLMLVQALRMYLAQDKVRGTGWLSAIGDSQLSPAIAALHSEPGKSWTLEQLARKAGMSRSKFAERFKTLCGASPIAYLARWRMMLACDRLVESHETIAAIAASLGYESEAAFGTAFKRIIGTSPGRFAGRTRGQRVGTKMNCTTGSSGSKCKPASVRFPL